MSDNNDSDDNKIRDLPSVQEAIRNVKTISTIREIYPKAKPILNAAGVDTTTIEHTLESTQNANQLAEDFRRIPDKFNEIFLSRGWIAYENMDFNVMKRAVQIAERDSEEFSDDERDPVEIAEDELVSYYDRETIQFQLTRLKQIDGFGPRSALAYKALDDYEAERYYASTLVVLSVMDGMVLQISSDTNQGATKGVWVNQADLEAWDSVAAYSDGLKKLVSEDMLHQPRKKTVVEDIDKPYRHGIIHGQDLGYDNKLVAAKTWATLFAVGEWALKAEKGELEEPTRDHASTPAEIISESIDLIIDAAENYQKAEQKRRRSEDWEPRNGVVDDQSPATTDPDSYEKGTPERALVTFLDKWKVENYGHMADFLRDGAIETDPGYVRGQCKHMDLKSFTLLEVTDAAPVRTEILVEMEFERFDNEESGEATVQLVRYNSDGGGTAFRDDENGVWIIENWESLLAAGAV